ncbi:MAG: hypothetical protein VX574_03180, partial [Myxococcota bacterium]|nr:hypothetical protein [Myxococcota bacterium]
MKSPLGRSDRYIPLVAFAVERRVLDRLEWPEVIHRLAGHCRLAPTRRWLASSLPSVSGEPGELFEATTEGVRERLHETSEARALLDNEQIPPLGSGPEIEEALDRARRGGLLAAGDLRAIGECLAGLEATARFARGHSETAPTLASQAEGLATLPATSHRRYLYIVEKRPGLAGRVQALPYAVGGGFEEVSRVPRDRR